ncbi:hypothetical protein T10_13637 [Trichinella papuae]|uniref:Uncharacterized protein n=1 Tax=Trichinella papuae TaxID=268474 RepID=A0A0V1MV95_9BILA|nr:hypothetical protein T10_13637 [Trichinella papuae]
MAHLIQTHQCEVFSDWSTLILVTASYMCPTFAKLTSGIYLYDSQLSPLLRITFHAFTIDLYLPK